MSRNCWRDCMQSHCPFLEYLSRNVRVFALAQNVRLGTTIRECNHGCWDGPTLHSLHSAPDFKRRGVNSSALRIVNWKRPSVLVWILANSPAIHWDLVRSSNVVRCSPIGPCSKHSKINRYADLPEALLLFRRGAWFTAEALLVSQRLY